MPRTFPYQFCTLTTRFKNLGQHPYTAELACCDIRIFCAFCANNDDDDVCRGVMCVRFGGFWVQFCLGILRCANRRKSDGMVMEWDALWCASVSECRSGGVGAEDVSCIRKRVCNTTTKLSYPSPILPSTSSQNQMSALLCIVHIKLPFLPTHSLTPIPTPTTYCLHHHDIQGARRRPSPPLVRTISPSRNKLTHYPPRNMCACSTYSPYITRPRVDQYFHCPGAT